MRKLVAGQSSGILALVLLAIYFGATAVLARYLSVGNDLFEQWYMRFGIATVAALLVFRKRINLKKFLHLPKRDWQVLALRVLSGGVAAIALYTLAAQQTKIGTVAFMQAVPIMALLAVVLMNDKLTPQKAGLVALSFIGAAAVVLENPRDLLNFDVGGVYSLLSVAFFSLAFLTRKWHTNTLNNQEITVAILALSFVATYVLSLVLYQRPFASTDEWSLLFVGVLFFAGIAAVGSIFLQNYGFERVGGVVAGNILNLELVFGPLFGFIIYLEGITSRELLGGLIILTAAIAMNELDRKKAAVVPTPD